MKFSITRETLIKPLQLVCGVVERRHTLPVLANILTKVTTESLSMTGTDLEVEIVTHTPLEDAEPGEVTIPARKFIDICRSLPDDATLEMSLSGERVLLKSGKSRFILSTLPAVNFPNIDAGQEMREFTIPQHHLKKLMDQTHFAMAHQDVRYYLNGMLLELGKGYLRLVATDGHRLALCDREIDNKLDEEQQVIVPRKGVHELMRLLEETDSPLRIQLGTRHIRAFAPDVTFTSKLIDGRFPDYRNVVPHKGDKTIICGRDALRQSLNRVSILSNEKYRGVRLKFSPDLLTILAHNPEHEEAEEEIAIDYQGSEYEIGFNVNYLRDAVTACGSEQVQFMFTTNDGSCVVQGVGEERCKYIVMPMRL